MPTGRADVTSNADLAARMGRAVDYAENLRFNLTGIPVNTSGGVDDYSTSILIG